MGLGEKQLQVRAEPPARDKDGQFCTALPSLLWDVRAQHSFLLLQTLGLLPPLTTQVRPPQKKGQCVMTQGWLIPGSNVTALKSQTVLLNHYSVITICPKLAGTTPTQSKAQRWVSSNASCSQAYSHSSMLALYKHRGDHWRRHITQLFIRNQK